MNKLIIIFLLSSSYFIQAQTVKYNTVAEGFNAPVDLRHAPDGRLFVVQQNGLIRIIENGVTLNTPFIDLTNITARYGEQGLLGMTFHPDYNKLGHFYVNYIDGVGNTVISRFTVSNDANIADRDSEKIIMQINQPFGNHNGGCLRFGPDGYLYIGIGDGGSGGDPLDNGQKRTTLLGKMLRIDIDTDDPYQIPSTNPFADDDFTLDEIWAIGLRNPWRFSFDRETGDLWIGDVGQDAYEEIDFQSANSSGGENYGWRCKEASEPFNTQNCPDLDQLVDPVLTLPQGPDCSVTGGYVYRGIDIPELFGSYIFGDFCSGRIYQSTNNNGTWENTQLPSFSSPSAFGQDQEGELYIASYGGRIVKIANIISSTSDIITKRIDLNIYPNPVKDQFIISLSNVVQLIDNKSTVKVFNYVGQLVYQKQIRSSDDLMIQTDTWAGGMYTVQVISEHGIGVGTVLKK